MDEQEKIVNQWLKEEADKPTKDAKIQRLYTEQVIAWIDILGMKSMISKKDEYDAHEIINIMNDLGSYVEKANKDSANKFEISQIADGVMIATELANCELLCDKLAEIQWKVLIRNCLLLRGAVTVGNVSIGTEEPRIIGPAYVDAYNLESNYAVYPRILLSQSCVDTIQKENKSKSLPQYIKQDFDKNYFVDYIEYIRRVKDVDLMKKELNNNDALKPSIKVMEQKDKPNLRIQQKHGWFIHLLETHGIFVEVKNNGE